MCSQVFKQPQQSYVLYITLGLALMQLLYALVVKKRGVASSLQGFALDCSQLLAYKYRLRDLQ